MDICTHDGIATHAHPSLVVMLKAPANAKRRLAAEIGNLAGEAASHLLACALEDALAWPGSAWLSPADPQDHDWLLSETRAETMPLAADCPSTATSGDHAEVSATHRGKMFHVIAQQGGNLGERINYVDGKLRKWGVADLLFVGTDCPGLDNPYLERAACALREADAVLGPASDGGVVLMGARQPWPELRALSWSTPALCAQLLKLCCEVGWSVATLDAREDIDNLQGLLGAGLALLDDQRPSRRGLAEWLRAHRGALLAERPGSGMAMSREVES